jgi:hypothetical protein
MIIQLLALHTLYEIRCPISIWQLIPESDSAGGLASNHRASIA